jgi:hypothetical protein
MCQENCQLNGSGTLAPQSEEALAVRRSTYKSISSVFSKSVELWHARCSSLDREALVIAGVRSVKNPVEFANRLFERTSVLPASKLTPNVE